MSCKICVTRRKMSHVRFSPWLVIVLLVCSACNVTQPASPTPMPPAENPTPVSPAVTETVAASAEISISTGSQMLAVKSIAASAQLADSPPEMAVDGDLETSWNSGGDAPQWLELDLGDVYQLKGVTLHVAQYPNGKTHHRLWGAVEAGNYSLLAEFSGDTVDKQTLNFQPVGVFVIRYLKIETTESPSWVAWAEIEVYGQPQQAVIAEQQAVKIAGKPEMKFGDFPSQPVAERYLTALQKMLTSRE